MSLSILKSFLNQSVYKDGHRDGHSLFERGMFRRCEARGLKPPDPTTARFAHRCAPYFETTARYLVGNGSQHFQCCEFGTVERKNVQVFLLCMVL